MARYTLRYSGEDIGSAASSLTGCKSITVIDHKGRNFLVEADANGLKGAISDPAQWIVSPTHSVPPPNRHPILGRVKKRRDERPGSARS